jgi:adenylosuccinate lyase
MNIKEHAMDRMSDKILAMFEGLGLNPEDIIQLEQKNVSQDELYSYESPFPALSRYRKYISFMDDLTSLKAWYKYRIMVIVEYFITLADTMAQYDGIFKDKKIIPFALNEQMKDGLRKIAHSLTPQQMAQIDAIEAKSDHDTAAITDWIKFIVDKNGIFGFVDENTREELESSLDGFHFGRTSEDVNSPMFALINRDLFFKHLIPEVLAVQESLINYARSYNLVIAGLTHGQPAEPTTIAKQIANTVSAIDSIIRQVFIPFNKATISFPVKTFGAVGNHSDLRSAYPDINWIENDQRFISALGSGVHLDMMATQANLYGEYKRIYDAVCTIARHILKFTNDFWGWTSFQWFRKKRKAGVKGSSVMPNKYNPWRIEGANKILEKFIVQLEYTSKALMDYPYEGDMGRSILMRDIGDDFAKFFIAIGRIKEELGLYEPNEEKIERFLNENPGLVGGSAQTILKRSRIKGDAYRQIQQIMINPDGSYVSQEEFIKRMAEDNSIPEDVKKEILNCANPQNNVGYADELATQAMKRAEETISLCRDMGYK